MLPLSIKIDGTAPLSSSHKRLYRKQDLFLAHFLRPRLDRMERVKTIWKAAAIVAGLLAAHNVGAGVTVIGEVGTTGIGAHAAVPLNDNFNLRFGTGYLDYSYHGNTRGFGYDLSLRAKTYDALLDWYPRADNSFRITAGLAYNGNRINATARPNAAGNYVINGNAYDAATVGKVTGKVDFGKLAPYLGIGWSRKVDKGWSYSTDLGVMFQGSPKSSLTSSGCTAPAVACSQFANELARENAAFRDEVGRFKIYPVLRIGLSYKF